MCIFVLTASVVCFTFGTVDVVSSPGLVKPKTIISVFSASLSKQSSLRSKSKDWLARNQDNVSEWSNIST